MNTIRKRSHKLGLSPGSLIYLGKKRMDKVKIHVIDYTEKSLIDKDINKIEECFPLKNKKSVSWINIDGLHDVEIIRKIGEHYGIHSLFLEDILNTDQSPKIEFSDDYILIITKMLSFDKKEKRIISEQISILLGKNFVISLQEAEGDFFDPVRERIRTATGKIRKMGADYLAYVLLDIIIDNYFAVLESIGDGLESVEDKLIAGINNGFLKEFYHLKRELLFLRRSVWPLREVINKIQKTENSLIKKQTYLFLKDLYDHTIHVIDSIEVFRDVVAGMQELHLSSVSNRMNEIMKVLTIISTIFIPLTFIVGLYGMNFQYLPELSWKYGYFFILEIMAIIACGMLLYFKRKKWL